MTVPTISESPVANGATTRVPTAFLGYLLATGAVLACVMFGALVAHDLWFVAFGMLAAIPLGLLVLRDPWWAVIAWIVTVPLVGTTDGGAVRAVYWLTHRALPVAALVIIIVGAVTGLRPRTLPKLGLPEACMAAYLGATFFSVLYTAQHELSRLFVLYDRVFIPMCLYLIVRLVVPERRELRTLVVAAVVVLVVQSVVGMVAWIGPAVLRPEWLGKVGERTTGTLQSPDLFGVTMLFCGLFVLHMGMHAARRGTTRVVALCFFGLSLLMLFMSFSRATWLASVLALIGLAFVYRRYLQRIIVVGGLLILVLAASGLLRTQWQYAQYRFDSQQSEASALSRLPVFLAAWRMFEAKPVTGFGYENFDSVDRRFQGRVGDLVYPDKNHASHNLFLTLLAEQGLVGFVLYLGPMALWFLASIARRARIPDGGVVNRALLVALWLVILGHIVVNNFSRMHLPFGLGMYWLTLGLIASIVDRYRNRVPDRPATRLVSAIR
ncbi:MAG TPA: O-antigen ligase family protein [Acidimicrobiia bacterium]|nr:O-antigen ligase family protein [Acidimicrobiia bacterium]